MLRALQINSVAPSVAPAPPLRHLHALPLAAACSPDSAQRDAVERLRLVAWNLCTGVGI